MCIKNEKKEKEKKRESSKDFEVGGMSSWLTDERKEKQNTEWGAPLTYMVRARCTASISKTQEKRLTR